MMVSTKGRYALRVMVDLSQHEDGSYIPLKDIAERQEISQKYLESIMVVLSKAGFVDSLHGKGGGYKLNRHPEEYTVGSILKLTEGSLSPVSCIDSGECTCQRSSECCTLPMWTKLDRLIDQFFESITIADILNEAASQQVLNI